MADDSHSRVDAAEMMERVKGPARRLPMVRLMCHDRWPQSFAWTEPSGQHFEDHAMRKDPKIPGKPTLDEHLPRSKTAANELVLPGTTRWTPRRRPWLLKQCLMA